MHGFASRILFPILFLAIPGVLAASGDLLGSSGGAGHIDPVADVILEILVIIIVARIGGHVAERFGQPSVLGELLVGVLLGAMAFLPLPMLVPSQLIEHARTSDSHIDILARIGVILLLFEVGLETRLSDLVNVGRSAILVALIGVAAPFALGVGASMLLIQELPESVNPLYVHLFLGAALSATSVGITARVLKDLGQLERRESRIILGAAVIDDVLGLIILAIVSGVISGGSAADSADIGEVLAIAGSVTLKALLFLAGAVLVGRFATPWVFKQIAGFRGGRMVLSSTLGFCFLMAFLANVVGLATIVGAFAAGLVLEDRHLRHFKFDSVYSNSTEALEHLLYPLSRLIVPIFFVQMGIQVRLESFLDVWIVLLGLALAFAAMLGKLFCAAVVPGGLWSRATIAFGMIPRGEVGLIFANIGLALGVLSGSAFSAVIMMVVITTFLTPPLLKLCLGRLEGGLPAPPEAPA